MMQSYGPRTIDLDILFYESDVLDIQGDAGGRQRPLQIPHPGVADRDFVLRPLCDIVPGAAPICSAATNAPAISRNAHTHIRMHVRDRASAYSRVLCGRRVSTEQTLKQTLKG